MIKKDRVFVTEDVDGKELKLRYRHPSQESITKSELIFKKVFSKCFREGMLTNSEVEKILRARDLWNEQIESEVLALKLKILDLEEKLDGELSDEEGLALCAELRILRNKLIDFNAPIVAISENTCESIAAEEQNQFLVSECILDDKTGMRVYSSVEDFKRRADEVAAAAAYKETIIANMSSRSGEELPSDLSKIYAENRWMDKHLKKKAAEAEAKDAEEVEEKPAKKKRGKKTKTAT